MNIEKQNEANSTFLYPCIHASLYSCFSPNKPNSVYLYTCAPVYLIHVHPVNPVKNIILQNKANLIRRVYVESRHPVHPRGTKAGRACQF